MSQLSIYGVRFKKASRVFDFDGTDVELSHGDQVIVEVEKGLGMGTVVNGPREPVKAGRKIKKVIRRADVTDVERYSFNTEREGEAFRICREKITKYNLPMKLVSVEYLFDSSKAIFYFTSDTRVDFRGLVKDLASAFHTRIEMRQIGVRDEAKMIGGLGPCGRALCCASFLSGFEPVTIKMAKDQNLALNPVKISGVCGRLMCCLSFEHEAYKKGKAGGHGSGHGCHKGGAKERHCGAHGAAKQGAEDNEKQPRERQGNQKQSGQGQAGERQGSRREPQKQSGDRQDRPDKNRQGRSRPNRNRSAGNRPNDNRPADNGRNEAGAADRRPDKGQERTAPGGQGTDGTEGGSLPRRPDSEGRGRSRNRNRNRNRNRRQQGNRQTQEARDRQTGPSNSGGDGKERTEPSNRTGRESNGRTDRDSKQKPNKDS